MKVKPTKTGITLELTVQEAVALEAILGRTTGIQARNFPHYDAIANVLEEHHLTDTTIYAATSALEEATGESC